MVNLESLSEVGAGLSEGGAAYKGYLATKGMKQELDQRAAQEERLKQTFSLGVAKAKQALDAQEQALAWEKEDREREVTERGAAGEAGVALLELQGAIAQDMDVLGPELSSWIDSAKGLSRTNPKLGAALERGIGAAIGSAIVLRDREKAKATIYEGRKRFSELEAEFTALSGGNPDADGPAGQDIDLSMDTDGDGATDVAPQSIGELGDLFVQMIDQDGAEPDKVLAEFNRVLNKLETERAKLRVRMDTFNSWDTKLWDPQSPYYRQNWKDPQDFEEAELLLQRARRGEFDGNLVRFEEEMEALANGFYLIGMQVGDDDTPVPVQISTKAFRANPDKFIEAMGRGRQRKDYASQDFSDAYSSAMRGLPEDLTPEEESEYIKGRLQPWLESYNSARQAQGLAPIEMPGLTSRAKREVSEGDGVAKFESAMKDPRNLDIVYRGVAEIVAGGATPNQALIAVLRQNGVDPRKLSRETQAALLGYLKKQGVGVGSGR